MLVQFQGSWLFAGRPSQCSLPVGLSDVSCNPVDDEFQHPGIGLDFGGMELDLIKSIPDLGVKVEGLG